MVTVQVATSQKNFYKFTHTKLFYHHFCTSWYISIDIIIAFYVSRDISIDINMNYYNITNKICRLIDETHEWSSTILLPDGDKSIYISSTAMGKASVTPANAIKQPAVYTRGKAASVYCFDPDIYDENS
jgi:hypothetical protein